VSDELALPQRVDDTGHGPPSATTLPPEPIPAGSPLPRPAPAITPPSVAPVPPTRRLIGASFDLLSHSSDDMRRASFYIGAIVLGTAGGYALAAWAVEVVTIHKSIAETEAAMSGWLGGWMGLLIFIGILGLLVAGVESRAMAVAILGGRAADRPVSVRSALARSRATFWRVIVASIIVAVPLGTAQVFVTLVLLSTLPTATELSTAVTVLVAALVGAPFAYMLTGVVLGDVDPFEAMKRSFRVFGARKAAAVLVALFESIAQLLILLGVGAGLDIGIRLLSSLGLGVYSGAAGIALTTFMIVAGVFAIGTLLFTVTAISIAPQVVMFVGLTHATMGLDHVRPGGDRDPDGRRPKQRRFRRFTRSMLLGFGFALAGLIGAIAALPD
jgi:hypothetical protein